MSVARIKPAIANPAPINNEPCPAPPIKLIELESKREGLLDQKLELNEQLFAARAAVKRKEEIAAAEKARQQLYVSYRPVYSSGSGASTSSYGSSQYYDKSYRPRTSDHYVNAHFRKDGTFVEGHMRSNRDDSFWNNFSSDGNMNPFTGHRGTKKPSW